MPIINFVNEKKQVQVPAGTNLRKAALQAGVALYPVPHNVLNCHGLGQCASCKVLVVKGKENASPEGWLERLRWKIGMMTPLYRIGHDDDMRLACQTQVNGDMEVQTRPSINLYGDNFFS